MFALIQRRAPLVVAEQPKHHHHHHQQHQQQKKHLKAPEPPEPEVYVFVTLLLLFVISLSITAFVHRDLRAVRVPFEAWHWLVIVQTTLIGVWLGADASRRRHWPVLILFLLSVIMLTFLYLVRESATSAYIHALDKEFPRQHSAWSTGEQHYDTALILGEIMGVWALLMLIWLH